jgi:hypothetical protein
LVFEPSLAAPWIFATHVMAQESVGKTGFPQRALHIGIGKRVSLAAVEQAPVRRLPACFHELPADDGDNAAFCKVAAKRFDERDRRNGILEDIDRDDCVVSLRGAFVVFQQLCSKPSRARFLEKGRRAFSSDAQAPIGPSEIALEQPKELHAQPALDRFERIRWHQVERCFGAPHAIAREKAAVAALIEPPPIEQKAIVALAPAAECTFRNKHGRSPENSKSGTLV